jgi:hypothetical protein
MDGMASEGDPRVLFVMNLVLSAVFGTGILWGLDFVGLATFTPRNAVVATLILMALTGIVVRVL